MLHSDCSCGLKPDNQTSIILQVYSVLFVSSELKKGPAFSVNAPALEVTISVADFFRRLPAVVSRKFNQHSDSNQHVSSL